VSSPDQFRIGDAERDRAAALLSEHMAEGRLTQPEFDERLDVAMKAKTAGELEPLFRDLPGPNPSRSAELASLADQSRLRANEVAAQSRAKQEIAPAVDPKWITALSIAVPVAWVLAGFAFAFLDVRNWMIFILPIVLSIVLGKLKGTKH